MKIIFIFHKKESKRTQEKVKNIFENLLIFLGGCAMIRKNGEVLSKGMEKCWITS